MIAAPGRPRQKGKILPGEGARQKAQKKTTDEHGGAADGEPGDGDPTDGPLGPRDLADERELVPAQDRHGGRKGK